MYWTLAVVHHMQLTVQATDNGTVYGPLSYTATLDIIVNKILRPPTVSSQVFFVNENSPVNTFVNVIPSSPRKGEALHFNITSGNTGSAFRVQECSGTVFVDLDVLDFESPSLSFFNLSIMVTGEMVANVTAVIYVRGAEMRAVCIPILMFTSGLSCGCQCDEAFAVPLPPFL
jgi:hypothetical protein